MSLTHWNSERGTAIVEGTLVLLLFFVLILGIIEAGRFMQVRQTLTDAAREGARLAVAPQPGTSTLPSVSQVQAEVQLFLNGNNIQGANISVVPVTNAQGDELTEVTASVDYQVISISLFSALEVPLSGTARMRNETSP